MAATMVGLVGTVEQVWRYPVKSLLGERLQVAEVDRRGIVDDRRWALSDHDGKLGSGKSTTRFRAMPGLLALAAKLSDGVPQVDFADGSTLPGDDRRIDARLSDHVGRPVTLTMESDVPHHDEKPIHLVTTASLAWLGAQHGHEVDVRRVRPSLVIASTEPAVGVPEAGWVGQRLRVGTVLLEITHETERCVMVTQGQPGIGADPDLLRTIGRVHKLTFGVHADVLEPGRVSVGDAVTLL